VLRWAKALLQSIDFRITRAVSRQIEAQAARVIYRRGADRKAILQQTGQWRYTVLGGGAHSAMMPGLNPGPLCGRQFKPSWNAGVSFPPGHSIVADAAERAGSRLELGDAA